MSSTGPAPAVAGRGSSARGRPAATSHVEIEQAAFRLFDQQGFEATTLEDIAEAVGVGRRTVTRYYRSKNDIPWGQFDRTLASFRSILAAMPQEIPAHEAVQRGILLFNDFPADAMPRHRDRMRLLLRTPALQAHAVLRYAEWRQVIAEFVAARTGRRPGDLLPQAVGQVSLAVSMTAYDAWLEDESADLGELLQRAMTELRDYVH